MTRELEQAQQKMRSALADGDADTYADTMREVMEVEVPRELIIDNRLISDDSPAYIVAEIGHNHGGSLTKAQDMVLSAKDAGASAVKFQTRHPKEVYARGTTPGSYDWESGNDQWMAGANGPHRQKLEFTYEQWHHLFEFCRAHEITAFSTPFDFSSADLLNSLGVPAFKIASGDATNIPLIEYVAAFKKPMIVSTGGVEIEDVDRIYKALVNQVPFALLQCSCIYPAPDDVLNLRVIETYRSRYRQVVTGLSTHNPDWAPTLAAFTLGGRIFEHHYTNNREWKGTDNHFSLTPETLAELVAACGTVQAALGSANKHQDPREHSYTVERQKSLVWAREVFYDTVVTRGDIKILCPGGGIEPYRLNDVIGQRVTHTVKPDEHVEWNDFPWVRTDAIEAKASV